MVLSTRGRCNDDAHRFPAWTKNFMHYFTCCKVEYILSISLQLKQDLYVLELLPGRRIGMRASLYCYPVILWPQAISS